VVKQFKHKGLETFFYTGITTGIQPAHAKRLRLILTALNQAGNIQDLYLPGLRLHPLRGNRQGYWAMSVRR
jgi:proteic killer suppression protein